jgi:hypothetical protein
MSVDPNTLKEGDRITFGGRITKRVYAIDNDPFLVIFADGNSLTHGDSLWELAELVKPELPTEFSFGHLGVDNNYHTDGGYVYTPKRLLKFLKKDVAALEAAGVKESD